VLSKPAHPIVKELDIDSGAILQNLVKGKEVFSWDPTWPGGRRRAEVGIDTCI
jgi:hypothetical protein